MGSTGSPSDMDLDVSSSDGAMSTEAGMEQTGGEPEADTGAELPPLPLECSRVDLLFIVDDSANMGDYQQGLAAGVPNFVDDVADAIAPVDDFHIGVVTTNEHAWNEPGCTDRASLVTHTGSLAEGRASCGEFPEGRYLTATTGIADQFDCMAKVGTDGPEQELPMLALDEFMHEETRCNEGFLRDDSLLVVVIVTDEAEGEGDPESIVDPSPPWPLTSPGTPTEWYDRLVGARGGVEDNIVVLSLIHAEDGPCDPYEIWPVETYGTTRYARMHDGKAIERFTEQFTYGLVGGICGDYGAYFSDTVDMIEQACIGYTAAND